MILVTCLDKNPDTRKLDGIGHFVMGCRSVEDDCWNFDGAVLVECGIRGASLDGRDDSDCDVATCDGLHYIPD